MRGAHLEFTKEVKENELQEKDNRFERLKNLGTMERLVSGEGELKVRFQCTLTEAELVKIDSSFGEKNYAKFCVLWELLEVGEVNICSPRRGALD